MKIGKKRNENKSVDFSGVSKSVENSSFFKN